MEEQAVNFLNEMSSGRGVQNENDDNTEQALSSPDSKSPRKGRKSVPRKLLQGQSVNNQGQVVNTSSLLEESDENTLNNDDNFSKYLYNSLVDGNEFDKNENFENDSVTLDTSMTLSIETSPGSKSLRKRKKPERVFGMETFEDNNFDMVEEVIEETDYIPNKKLKINSKSTKLDSLLKEKFSK